MARRKTKAFWIVQTLLVVACSVAPAKVAASPESDAKYAAGLVEYKKANYAAAVQLFEESQSKGNSKPENYLYIGHCYTAMGKRQQATKTYQQIMSLFPGKPASVLAAQCLWTLSSSAKPGAVPSATVSGVASGKAGDDKIEMPPEERIPYSRHYGDHLYVRGAVNGRATQVLIDTGAFKVVIGKDDLIDLGIKPPEGASTIIGSGAAGALRGWEMPLEVSIGRIKRKMPVTVIDGRQPMLLGQPFLSGMHYSIDRTSNYILFTRDAKDFQKQISYDSVEVPFRMLNGNLMVMVKVNGQPTEMNFDTGAPYSLFNRLSMIALGLEQVAMTTIRGAGDSMMLGYECIADSIELGPIRKQRVSVVASPGGGQNVLGQDFFGHNKFVVDNEKKVIRFSR